uniref:Uncharacterized protein n=1 Tax=Meloidogyne hapla TaxID=6305 RepID=A0A1I8BE99_MELHA
MLNPNILKLFKNKKRFDIFNELLENYEVNINLYDSQLDEEIIDNFEENIRERCENLNEFGIYNEDLEKMCESIKDVFEAFGVENVDEEFVEEEEIDKIKKVFYEWVNKD